MGGNAVAGAFMGAARWKVFDFGIQGSLDTEPRSTPDKRLAPQFQRFHQRHQETQTAQRLKAISYQFKKQKHEEKT